MTELSILVARIRAHESYMNKVRGSDKVTQSRWEELVRDLKRLNEKKEALNRKISQLKGH
jgi:hypothetical protein